MRDRRSLLERGRSIEGVLVVTTATGVITSIVIARSLGPVGRGQLTAITVWIQVLGFIGAFTLGHALTVHSRRPEDPMDPAIGLHESVRLARPLTLAATAVAFTFGLVSEGSLAIALLMVLGVAATSAMELWQGYLLGISRQATYLTIRLLQPLLYLIGVTLVALGPWDLPLGAQVLGLVGVLILSLGLPTALSYARARPAKSTRSTDARWALLRFAVGAQAGMTFQYLNQRLDLLALPFGFSNADVGIYAVGVAPAQFLVLIGGAGTIRAFTGEQTRRDVRGIVSVAALAGLWIVASSALIPWVFGADFTGSVPIARISALGAVAGYAMQHATGLLLWEKRTSALVVAQGMGAAAFLIGFLASQSLTAVAWASTTSYCIALAIAEAFLLLHRRDGIPATEPDISQERSPRILVPIDHFLPGFKVGGPARSVKNIAFALAGDFDFLILTRDRDLGERSPFQGIHRGRWVQMDRVQRRVSPRASGHLGIGSPHPFDRT